MLRPGGTGHALCSGLPRTTGSADRSCQRRRGSGLCPAGPSRVTAPSRRAQDSGHHRQSRYDDQRAGGRAQPRARAPARRWSPGSAAASRRCAQRRAHDVGRRAARAEQERREEQQQPHGLGGARRRQHRPEQDAEADEGHCAEHERGTATASHGARRAGRRSGRPRPAAARRHRGHGTARHQLGDRERPSREAGRRETAQHAALAVGRQVHRQHDQPGRGDNDREVRRDVPVRGVDAVERRRWAWSRRRRR